MGECGTQRMALQVQHAACSEHAAAADAWLRPAAIWAKRGSCCQQARLTGQDDGLVGCHIVSQELRTGGQGQVYIWWAGP